MRAQPAVEQVRPGLAGLNYERNLCTWEILLRWFRHATPCLKASFIDSPTMLVMVVMSPFRTAGDIKYADSLFGVVKMSRHAVICLLLALAILSAGIASVAFGKMTREVVPLGALLSVLLVFGHITHARYRQRRRILHFVSRSE
jgi:hypothetical protein